MIDPMKLAELPKDEPLTIFDRPSGFTCVINGCTQEAYAWRVKLPRRAGLACPGCAGDAGFETR